MKKIVSVLSLGMLMVIASCVEANPNKEINSEMEERNIIDAEDTSFSYPEKQKVYVPIYSDIYNQQREYRVQLTATLSIRNTSATDSVFIKYVDYYNTEGALVRNYIESPIFLKPMETIEYVIEKEDEEGGSGANFLIEWGANDAVTPLFQSVMVGEIGQHSFAFTTNGIHVTD